MNQRQGKKRKVFLYGLYGLLLTLGLLYYRFPSDVVRDYLQAAVTRELPLILFSVEKVDPILPPGLKLLNLKLTPRGRPGQVLFRSTSLSIRPELLALFRGETKYAFDSQVYGGRVQGTLHLMGNDRNAPFVTSIHLKDIDIARSAYLQSLVGQKIGGILGGTLRYDKRSNLLIDGTGEADLRVTEGSVVLSEPILTFDKVKFSELSIRMALKDQRIDLTQVALKGREVQGTLSGTIGLRRELPDCTLDLRGKIEPLAGFLQGIGGDQNTMQFLKQYLKMGSRSFVIHGTLGRPIFRFT